MGSATELQNALTSTINLNLSIKKSLALQTELFQSIDGSILTCNFSNQRDIIIDKVAKVIHGNWSDTCLSILFLSSRAVLLPSPPRTHMHSTHAVSLSLILLSYLARERVSHSHPQNQVNTPKGLGLDSYPSNFCHTTSSRVRSSTVTHR